MCARALDSRRQASISAAHAHRIPAAGRRVGRAVAVISSGAQSAAWAPRPCWLGARARRPCHSLARTDGLIRRRGARGASPMLGGAACFCSLSRIVKLPAPGPEGARSMPGGRAPFQWGADADRGTATSFTRLPMQIGLRPVDGHVPAGVISITARGHATETVVLRVVVADLDPDRVLDADGVLPGRRAVLIKQLH